MKQHAKSPGSVSEASPAPALQRHEPVTTVAGPSLINFPVHPPASEGQRLGGVSPSITSALGSSFSDVNVHTDQHAAQLAASHDAVAITVGTDIYYGSSAPRPGSLAGDALLAHELAHVEQQRGAAETGVDMNPSPTHEANADDAVAHAAAAHLGQPGVFGSTWRAMRTGYSLQRCPTQTDQEKRIQDNRARFDVLEKSRSGPQSVSDKAATNAEEMALRHWLAVDTSGRGTQRGTEAKPETPDVATTNCTEYVKEVLQTTFGDKEWRKLENLAHSHNATGETGLNGLPLQQALIEELGWKAIFWARDPSYTHYKRKRRVQIPDPKDPKKKITVIYIDPKTKLPVWDPDSEPQDRAKLLKKRGTYYGLQVSQSVIDYHPEQHDPNTALDQQWTPEDSKTPKDTSTLDKLRTIPFGVLTMYGADHMAILIKGVVYEVHWDQQSTSFYLYQAKDLENYGWHTGLVVVPADEFQKAFGKP